MAILVLTFVAPFVFFSTPMTALKTESSIALLWQEILYPFEYVFHKVSTTASTGWRHYIDLSDAAIENDRLKRELDMLQTRIMDYEHQVNEVERLRKLLGFTQAGSEGITIAEVISTSTGTPFQSLRISRGTSSEVQVGMPVVAAKGVVGRILRAGSKFSDVQLLSDGSFHLDVLIERTRTRGVLQGVGQNRCRLQLHRRADIRIGDTIITSGIVGGFPKGLPIGRVIKISYESDDVSQVITIQPWVDYRQLEEVVVLHRNDNSIETIVETAGRDWVLESLRRSELRQ